MDLWKFNYATEKSATIALKKRMSTTIAATCALKNNFGYKKDEEQLKI